METSLHGAARALEDAFFARENARLLEQLRAKAQHEERRKALREVIRIPDEHLVDHLLELGLGPETVLAVTLVPAREVAGPTVRCNRRSARPSCAPPRTTASRRAASRGRCSKAG